MPIPLRDFVLPKLTRGRRVMARSVVLPLAFVISGCVATDYKPAISTFATAMKRADDTFGEFRSATNTAYQDLQKRRIVATGSPIGYDNNNDDCGVKSARCRLVWIDRTGKKTQFTGLEAGKELRDLTRGLVVYADKLAAIVDAETAKGVSANLTAVKGSILETVDAVNKVKPDTLDAAAFKDIADPVTNLVTWAIGEYVNHLQVQALRTATKSADPVVKKAAELLGDLDTVGDLKAIALRNEVVERKNEFEDDRRNTGKLDRLQQAAEKYDIYLVTRKGGVFEDMGKAHAKLTAQLDGRDVTLAEAERAVQVFAAKAEALWKIIEQFKKIGEPKQPSK